MIKIKNGEVYSTTDKYIKLINSDTTFKRAFVPNGYDESSYLEVDEKAVNIKEYREEVERLIAQRYSIGQEVQFAREKELAGESYTEYLAYVEYCKELAKQNLESK